MVTWLELTSILLRGLPSEGTHWLARQGFAELGLPAAAPPLDPTSKRRITMALRARGYLKPSVRLEWPEPDEVERLLARVAAAGLRLLWRDGSDYPTSLQTSLAEQGPAWLWLAGDPARLRQPAVAVIGSRQITPQYQQAAFELGRALAAAGINLVSGGAHGSDAAAQAGAQAQQPSSNSKPGGAIIFLAEGILRHRALGSPEVQSGRLMLLGLRQPANPFSAHLAIARNDLIAAHGRALVLVASGLQGGSSYALDWARRHRRPIFCFESDRNTPAANRHLLRAGIAHALKLAAPPAQWVDQLQTTLKQSPPTEPNRQPELF